jgi:hypothetical protein
MLRDLPVGANLEGVGEIRIRELSLDELNERITGWEVADEARRITGHTHNIGDDLADERPLLRRTVPVHPVG